MGQAGGRTTNTAQNDSNSQGGKPREVANDFFSHSSCSSFCLFAFVTTTPAPLVRKEQAAICGGVPRKCISEFLREQSQPF